MFSADAMLALTFTTVIAAITCALTLAAGASWPAALLTAGAAAGGTLGLLPKLLRDERE